MDLPENRKKVTLIIDKYFSMYSKTDNIETNILNSNEFYSNKFQSPPTHLYTVFFLSHLKNILWALIFNA